MNIYESIIKVMSDIGAVGKNSKSQQGYSFRGIDAVMNALNPALITNKVFAVPTVIETVREERTNSKGTVLIYSICKVKYTFYAEDGSFVEAVVTGEGMDSGDKATNKAMSAAFKYACFQVFCIPTKEMVDSEAESEDLCRDNDESTNYANLISPQQKADILKEVNRTRCRLEDVCDRYGIKVIDDLPARKYEAVMKILLSMESR